MSPASVDLGTIDVGTTSTPTLVTVTNVGTKASGALTVTVVGTGITATGCTGTLAALTGTCTISITARPAVAGAISGSILVAEGSNPAKTVAVSGIATPPGGFSLTPPGPVDLGKVLVKGTASTTIVMTNTSPTGLANVVITVNGTGFTQGATSTCTDSLAVGQTCNIVVGFTGATAGPAAGSVIVSQGGVTKSVALTATVQSPAKLAMTPATAALTAQVGSASSPVTFYVTNSGDVASGIPSVVLSGLNAADFSITANSCVTALVGGATASCQATVVFSPKVMPVPAANETATLTVTDPGPGASSATGIITGTPVPPSALVITGTPDLGTVVVGATGTAGIFTLSNTGGTNSGTITVTTNDAQFILSADLCTGKDLAKAATCTFSLQFKPSVGTAGVVTKVVQASGAGTANPGVLSITGTAVPPGNLVATPTVLDFGSVPTSQESTPLTLTITNTGGAPTAALVVTNTGAQFKIKGDTCTGAALTAAGTTKSCTIIVTFTAVTVNVDAAGSITVTDGKSTASASLHGAGMAHPTVVMAPQQVCPQYTEDDPLCTPMNRGFRLANHAANQADASFPDKVVGATTPELTVTVYNETDPTFAVDSGTLSFTITGPAAADFAIVKNNCTAPLVSTSSFATAPTSCVLTLTATPSAVGLRNALLVLTTSRSGIAQTTLEAKGLAPIEVQPLEISKTKTGLDFGQVPLGDDDPNSVLPYRVWVRSTTSADHNTTVTVTLPTPTPADFVWPAGSGASFTYTIINPDDLLTPPVAIVSSAIGGGGVNGCTNKTLSLALGVDGKPTTAAITANAALGYSYDSNSGYFYCDFPVQFYPHSARGALSAVLTGTGSGGGTSALTLTGNATGPLVITPSPGLLAEPVAVGLASSTNLTLTITNKGAIPETGLTFGLSGTGASDFQIIGTTCWGQSDLTHHAGPVPTVKLDALQPGDFCWVWLGFQPQSQGSYSVTFTATAANGAGATDDETATDIIQATGSKTFGALTVTPNPGVFADTAYRKTDAAPVTFVVKNNGTLDTGPATIGFASGATDPNFEIVTPVGVAGACNITGVWTVAGGGSCTVQVRAKPSADPDGDLKKLLRATLKVSADPGGTVLVPLAVYETSNLMVNGQASVAYTFDPAGVGSIVSHNFTVSNLGSSPVSLAFSNPVGSSFAVDESVTGLTPVACKTGASILAAGAQCTLVVKNSNSAAGLFGVPLPLIVTVLDSDHPANYATVLLSSTTLATSHLITYGLDLNSNAAAGTTSTGRISLGNVPFGQGQGGVATVWFKNTGGVATQPLHFRWDSPAAAASAPTAAEKGTADAANSEFILTSLYPENPQACLSGTSGGGQQVAPQSLCSVSFYFKPSISDSTNLATRFRDLVVLDVNTAPEVYVQAAPVATASVFVQEISSANNEGFFQFTAKTPTVDPLAPEKHTFQVTNALTTAVTLSLVNAAPFTVDYTGLGANACNANPTLAANGTTCQFIEVFQPSASTPVFPYVTLSATNLGTGVFGLMGRTRQPVSLTIMKAVSAPGAAGTVDFGTVAIGGTKTQTLTVVNTGDVAMTSAAPLVVAEAANTYATFTDDGACQGKVLAGYGSAGDRCVTTVTATGVTLRTAGTTTTFQAGSGGATDAPAATYTLAVVVQKAAALTATAETGWTNTFPATAVTGYYEETFTIVNGTNTTDYQTSGVVGVTIGGTGASQFQLVGTTCPASVGLLAGPANGCEATVRFAPTALSPDGNAITASLNVAATPGSAAPVTILGMPKSALTITPFDTGTDAAPKLTMSDATTTQTQVFHVAKDGTAIPTAALKTSITGTDFIMDDDQCYGKVLSGASAGCDIYVKYVGAATTTAKTTTLTVNGGSAGQSAAIVLSYTGAAAASH